MSTAREAASSKMSDLEQYVQKLEQEWKDAQATLVEARQKYKTLPEDDESGYDEISEEIDALLERDGERF